ALNICMRILDNHANSRRRRVYIPDRYRENDYIWDRDYPISLQESKRAKPTEFRLEFELNSEEQIEFKDEIGSSLNGSLPILITIDRNSRPDILVVKSGKGSSSLNRKSAKIAEYIGRKIYFNYIPAIRTGETFLDVIDDALNEALLSIENEPRYLQAIETIKELQKPIIDKLSDTIKLSLSEFIPNINDVEIKLNEAKRRFHLRRSYNVNIDDGHKTDISLKGDGVKSLSALGMLKNISNINGVYSLIAIEEPESHLHPEAIHILKDKIYGLKDSNQVIISSHNPLFVDRENISNNIIVNSGSAIVARNVRMVRDILGVRASDNLTNSNFVLVVEGEEDLISLRVLLSHFSSDLSKALKNHQLIIDKLGGAGNLSYKLSSLRSMLCNYHVLLDNDKAGKDAFSKAERDKLLTLKNVTYINCNGMNESEFENCLDLSLYKDSIESLYGVSLDCREYKQNASKKWSERMKVCFKSQGKDWGDKVEREVKSLVANLVAECPSSAVNPHHQSWLMALIRELESLIKK
ncbi:ATP-dependent nuclease, partial [Rodentibacter ratti]